GRAVLRHAGERLVAPGREVPLDGVALEPPADLAAVVLAREQDGAGGGDVVKPEDDRRPVHEAGLPPGPHREELIARPVGPGPGALDPGREPAPLAVGRPGEPLSPLPLARDALRPSAGGRDGHPAVVVGVEAVLEESDARPVRRDSRMA